MPAISRGATPLRSSADLPRSPTCLHPWNMQNPMSCRRKYMFCMLSAGAASVSSVSDAASAGSSKPRKWRCAAQRSLARPPVGQPAVNSASADESCVALPR